MLSELERAQAALRIMALARHLNEMAAHVLDAPAQTATGYFAPLVAQANELRDELEAIATKLAEDIRD